MRKLFCLKVQCGIKFNIKEIKQTTECFENNDISLFYIGNIFNRKQKKISMLELYSLYKEHRKKIVDYLDGTYSIIIIDKKEKKLYVFQDFLGSNQSIYFYKCKEYILISNELKQIILEGNENWKLNRNSIKLFLDKGFIVNKETLVKSIYKIPGRKYLEIRLDNAKCSLRKSRYNKKCVSKNVNMELYNKTLEKVCCDSIFEKMGVAISSGYDTNFILYNIKKNVNEKINVFSIGGMIGRNEVPNSEFISKYYDNINFYSRLVNGSSLLNFPEIVFGLEGAIYESGIFLQYELAKLINEKNVENMIFGDCADQVLHYNLYHPFNAIIDKILYYIKNYKIIFRGIKIKPYKDIYEMASYKVLKKNGILMNYFGINSTYPYLRKKFVEIAQRVVIKGDNNKSYHKETIHKTLPAEVVQFLKKIGGATELKTLFIGKVTLTQIKELAQNSVFYKEKKFNDEFYKIDYFMKIIYLELFEKIFIKENKKFLGKEFKNYDLLYFFPELNNGD